MDSECLSSAGSARGGQRGRLHLPANWGKFAVESSRMRIPDSDARFQLQKNTLRFLCSVLIKSGTRAEICKLLDPGVFEEPLQRVVFEEIRALGSIDSRRLRELLPARVTDRGFPDFDLDAMLAPREASGKEIDQLFEIALQFLDLSNPEEKRPAD